MEFRFSFLEFAVVGEKVFLKGSDGNLFSFVEINVAGENKDSHFGVKTISSSECGSLKYVSHDLRDNSLTIVQRGEHLEVSTCFTVAQGTDCVSVYTEAKNVTDGIIVVDQVSSFVYADVCPTDKTENAYLYDFTQSHHVECQPRKTSLYELGLFENFSIGQRRVAVSNVGSWSSKESLPQGIIEYDGKYTMFRIESNNSWYYEMSDLCGADNKYVYLYLGGATGTFGDFYVNLIPQETYRTPTVAIAVSDSLNGVIGEMTKYSRSLYKPCKSDKDLPVIFNEYMHLSWDCPTEENTSKYVPSVAALGVKYYVIDCGWHNEEDGKIIYPYVGQWKESKARFPHGVKAITDYIRAHGMKAGLWIEPEVVGYKCKEMLDYYDEDCFIHRYGKRVCVMGRYFLNFRNQKVINYLNETIRRMVEDYGADYIKTDYNQDLGIGVDNDDGGFGLGLEKDRKAYLEWIDSITEKYPDVIIENCSSGGMRMDGETLKHFSLTSTSDQINYKKYPYIAANILSSVIPEQAAVWSYPVASDPLRFYFIATKEWAEANVDKEKIAMNMINSFLGRMHLASDVGLLNEEKTELLKEGIDYYNYLTPAKKVALPCFPSGFTDFHKKNAACGLKTENKVYLAVWNLGDNKPVTVNLDCPIKSVTVGYPKNIKTDFAVEGNALTVKFPCEYSARFFEIEMKK